MAKKNLDSIDKKKQKYEIKLPEEYEVIDIIVKGKQILVNLKEMLEIKNTENKGEVISVMNKASSHYFYFSRVEVELKDILIQEKEGFELWQALIKNKKEYKELSSEKAKDMKLMSDHTKEYTEKKEYIRTLENYRDQASIAKDTLKLHIGLISSIGAMIRSQQSMTEPSGDIGD